MQDHVLLLLLVLLLSVTFALQSPAEQKSVPTSDINERYLQKLLENLNTTADPCDDFFEYACGNWAKYYESRDYVDMPGYMDNKVNKQLLDILTDHKHRSGIYAKLWHYYQSCQEIDGPALNYYLKLVQTELNLTWPIFREDWQLPWENETNFDWLSTVARLRRYGLNGVFLTQNVNVRLTNGSHFLIEVHQHQPRLELVNNDLAQIFINFGMTEEESESVTNQIMELEEKLNNITIVDIAIGKEEDDQKYKNSFKEITLQELMVKAPDIDWQQYFEIVLEHDLNTEKEIVQIFALNFEYFSQLVTTLNNTSNETICYYIMLKFMYQLNEDMPRNNIKPTKCIKHLRGYMPLAMNFLYEEYHYKAKRKETDAALLKMDRTLRATFEKLLEENFLELNVSEKAYISEELKTMQLKIGNIPADLTQEFVEDYYTNVSIDATNFYANHLELLKFITKQQQSKLRNVPIPRPQLFYEHDPETASSSSPVKIFDNAILVPYGYLQLPLFHPDLDALFQYSLFGFILSHEIVHAYDLFHIVYDQNGNYNDLGFAIAHHFWKYIECFAQNPSDRLSENIADVAGLRLAYQAYFDDTLNHPQTEPVAFTAANLTSQQLFFINSVQFLCGDMAKISLMNVESLKMEHDIHNVRVQQNWAKFEQFAVAFSCANGTTMHPTQKCRLW